MLNFIKWWIFSELLGWAIYPIAFVTFPKFKDRGFSVSKTFAVLIIGVIYWLLNTFSIIGNNGPGVYFSFCIIVLLSLFSLKKNKLETIINWLKENRNLILFYEIVFFSSFLLWTAVRSTNPIVAGTEKPMEQAFIMGVFRSPNFPPRDPWLSGYSISYYYFGFMIVAMFMHITKVGSGVAFNLAIALWFALIFVNASGILLNLLEKIDINSKGRKRRNGLFISLLSPFMILFVGNAEGFLESIHSAGLFWNRTESGQLVSKFWSWLGIQELINPPMEPLDFIPSRQGGTWWWRASRVLQDFAADGTTREIIDEFPFFSFLLGDFHPHLIAIPFGLLIIYIAFYLFQHQEFHDLNLENLLKFFRSELGAVTILSVSSLIFINTWDFPIYFALVVVSIYIPILIGVGWTKESLKFLLCFALLLGGFSIMLMMPFLLGLSTQAGGFLPSLIFQTRPIHFLIMFLPLLIPILFASLGDLDMMRFKMLYKVSGIIFILLLLVVFSLLLGIYTLSNLPGFNNFKTTLMQVYGAKSINELLSNSFARIFQTIFLKFLLILICALAIVEIFIKRSNYGLNQENKNTISLKFIFILLFFAGLLSLAPEIFYLKDQFGWRMNTIFKFYFQVWIFLAITSSYFLIRIFDKKNLKIFAIVISVLLIFMGMFYPYFSLRERFTNTDLANLSLDGNRYVNIDEIEAVEVLQNSEYGNIIEAVGGSYSSYGRISKLSGLPTVLGWPGHELQWRGGTREFEGRESDVRELYSSSSWEKTEAIIDKYDLRYIYIGNLERTTYSLNYEKFLNNLPILFKTGEVTIFFSEDD